MQNRLPAEWEAQFAVMLTWPQRRGPFATDDAAWQATEQCFQSIANAIRRFTPLIVSAPAGLEHERLKAWLDLQQCPHPASLYALDSDDVWARDHGPIGVYVGTQPRLLKFGFDGWGGKYPAQQDNALGPQLGLLGAFGPRPLHPVELVLEGGAIETDGAGGLLATRSSVLDPRRNPGRSAQDIETLIRTQLGIDHLMWLEHGQLMGDDTDGHIDTLVRFAATDTLVYQASGGTDDINHASLQALEQELRQLRQKNGQPYQLLPLPWPGLHRDAQGDPLPASYANYLISNGGLLAPTYGVPQDAQALALLMQAYPEHEVVGIDCQALIRQYGSLHCVSMNIPA